MKWIASLWMIMGFLSFILASFASPGEQRERLNKLAQLYFIASIAFAQIPWLP